ncbi:hypothetical protein [Alicyclobacillus sp. ALC3]|uniref:hypothetical protein n=1 Tax=Alicyclobacillus sp. ALC3 TaxID=2796143 RepID=UPI0023790F07|nr:hypothetical protein [Alicyclobacillus sp. ALC3]WDL97971.1 hypothetical protein JC200_04465 [Alicyclobacillus sp. ALC3]
MRFRGVPLREIHGLPYTVHQTSAGTWQVAIQNCERHPAGYSYPTSYNSYADALSALESWGIEATAKELAGDDTGAAEIVAKFED